MNEKEINTLKGRALDLAIERYVFGNEKPPDNGTIWLDDNHPGFNSMVGVAYWPPKYHNSDYLAFRVVEKLRYELFYHFKLESTDYGDWIVTFEQYPRYILVEAETRPLAICRAALKVVCSEN